MSNSLPTRTTPLSAAKQALLAQRLQGKIPTHQNGQAIPRRSPQCPDRLSFAQQRLWFCINWNPIVWPITFLGRFALPETSM
ncbi:MAG: hypothetical protein HC768_03180 [Acaryochloris sp. CRU_2_0]|nr:hypothetical protein [Acaryochloris sp. CRU_2_0]